VRCGFKTGVEKSSHFLEREFSGTGNGMRSGSVMFFFYSGQCHNNLIIMKLEAVIFRGPEIA
jgi:hypothetical protein